MALTFVAVARWGAGCGHSTPVTPGLCLVLIASFLPTNEKTEDSEHNTSFYFRFSAFIPKTFSYLVQLTFSPQRRKEGTDFFFFKSRKERNRKNIPVETHLLDSNTSFISGFIVSFHILKYFSQENLLTISYVPSTVFYAT